jgi:hypothetical protein
MVLNPRTHPKGAPPTFDLPKPNPNPSRMTNALWWLVCMREALEPDLSDNGGTFADKPGSHNAGENLPDFGEGDSRTDHSIRHEWNRTGPWWKKYTAAHDWTFRDAQQGKYSTINKYTKRRIAAMQDPNDLRPDKVVFYVLGNTDSDIQTEGYNEIKNAPETSGDNSHAWHIHDSFFRNIVGDFWAMWKSLTIDMGWTYAEWQRSVAPKPEVKMDWDDKIEEGTVGDTGADWRTFRQEAADLQNERNWDYAPEGGTTTNPPPANSRVALLHSRVKSIATEVPTILAQSQSNGTGLSLVNSRLTTLEGKIDRILALLEAQAPPPE